MNLRWIFFPLQKVKWSILRTYNYEFFHVKISRVVSSEMLYSLQFPGFYSNDAKKSIKSNNFVWLHWLWNNFALQQQKLLRLEWFLGMTSGCGKLLFPTFLIIRYAIFSPALPSWFLGTLFSLLVLCMMGVWWQVQGFFLCFTRNAQGTMFQTVPKEGSS